MHFFHDEIATGNVAVNSQGGFKIAFETMELLNFSGDTHSELYSIGYPTQGSVLISNSVELLRQNAVKIANNIFKKIIKDCYENNIRRN